MAKVTDLMAHQEQQATSIDQRIERRIIVLSNWLANGVPPNKFDSLPISLNDAREWEDCDLDIERIPSPRSFTKVHPNKERGKNVVQIEKLLSDIREKWAEPRGGKIRGRLSRKKREAKSSAPWGNHSVCESCLEKFVNNYHIIKSRLDDAQALNESEIHRLEEKDRQIARLTKELAAERQTNQRSPRSV